MQMAERNSVMGCLSITSETGDLRSGDEFKFVCNPANCASSTFAALTGDGLLVTRRATALFHLSEDTPVLAHWHGQHRTDGFAMTVGVLKAKALVWLNDNEPLGKSTSVSTRAALSRLRGASA
jgi:hypothetical protein